MTEKDLEAVKSSLKELYKYNEFKIIEKQKFEEIINLLNNDISIEVCIKEVLPFLKNILNRYYEIEKKDAQEVGYFPNSLSEYRVSHICMLYIPPIQEFIKYIEYTVNILLKQKQQLKKLPSYLHTRYKELLIAVNNNMPLSFLACRQYN